MLYGVRYCYSRVWDKDKVDRGRGEHTFIAVCISVCMQTFSTFVCLFWPRSPAPQSRIAVSDWPLGGVQRDNPERPFGARLDLPQIFSAAGNSILNQSSLQDLNWLDHIYMTIQVSVRHALLLQEALNHILLLPSSDWEHFHLANYKKGEPAISWFRTSRQA